MIRLLLLLAAFFVASDASADNAGLYKRCASCHLPTGAGIPGIYPGLTDRLGPLAATPAGRDYLVMVVHAGLTGPINVKGTTYSGVMPPQGSGLSDEQLAGVLNFILDNFNKKSLPPTWTKFSVAEVGAIREKHAKLRARDVIALRPKSLGGR
ncbi:c-type cytochrome [Sphingosinicella microcystinivorans]|uniref:c-type cytochrome n=1 Tax=Sphingosinicella microcystinivorans TaxID=335406 RepID=UPI0022F3F655|nr:cytochrome c [Sphingosinicella microcystinivorans]WBX84615.1 cytochrome c [Sphingosinicella microcystinivorans]